MSTRKKWHSTCAASLSSMEAPTCPSATSLWWFAKRTWIRLVGLGETWMIVTRKKSDLFCRTSNSPAKVRPKACDHPGGRAEADYVASWQHGPSKACSILTRYLAGNTYMHEELEANAASSTPLNVLASEEFWLQARAERQ